MKHLHPTMGIPFADSGQRVRRAKLFTTLCLLASFSVVACERRGPPGFQQMPQKATDKWMGRWNGPEGTYLELSRSGDRISIQIKDLDTQRSYQGTARDDSISFVRDGKTETIHAANGEQTGMKWLADKKDCLVIRAGDGYCRD
jgi:hypothetical protein